MVDIATTSQIWAEMILHNNTNSLVILHAWTIFPVRDSVFLVTWMEIGRNGFTENLFDDTLKYGLDFEDSYFSLPTASKPSLSIAEHSKYLTAPIWLARESPST